MFRVFAFVLLAAAGCYRSSADADHCTLSCNADSPCPNGLSCNGSRCSIDGQSCDDVASDGARSACAGSMSGLLGQICFDPVPPPALLDQELETIDTDNDLRCRADAGNDLICLFVVDDLPTLLRGTGLRPLVLWSPGTLVTNGSIDVATHTGKPDSRGAGAFACPGVAGIDGKTAAGIDSGGAGGSFSTAGGNGGAGGTTAGGFASGPTALPNALRGGCPGGIGGGIGPSDRADGGGAVYLMATEKIVVGGVINASGGGGAGPDADGAGHGGGSGGLIGFDAPKIEIEDGAIVLALGGGGSSGGQNGGNQGNAGNEPQVTPPTPADGMPGPTNCTGIRGGAGATGASGNVGQNGSSGSAATGCNAAGGGGGSGFVITFGDVASGTAAVVLPAVFVPPAIAH